MCSDVATSKAVVCVLRATHVTGTRHCGSICAQLVDGKRNKMEKEVCALVKTTADDTVRSRMKGRRESKHESIG